MICKNQNIHTQIITPEIDKFYWFPIIAQYNASKQSLSADYHIASQKQRFIGLINKADKITIVGVRYMKNDKHIWKHVINSKARKLIVEPQKWDGPNKKNISILKEYFDSSISEILKFNDINNYNC